MKKSRRMGVPIALLLALVTVTAVSALVYRVQRGDTLFGIAARHGTTVDRIVQDNNIRNRNLIRVGQELIIDADGGGTQPPPSPEPPPGDGSTYVVRRGDTLSKIARQFGTSVSAIARAELPREYRLDVNPRLF